MSDQKLVKDHLKVEEVAELLERNPEVIKRWCRTGVIKARKIGKRWYIPKSILDTLVKETN